MSEKSPKKDSTPAETFDWAALKREIDTRGETRDEKSGVPESEASNRKIKLFENENHRRIFNYASYGGMGLTALALTLGVYSFLRGYSTTSQTMMRARVGFQGMTLAIFTGGLMFSMKTQFEANQIKAQSVED